MLIENRQIKNYEDNGFLLLPRYFSQDEVNIMTAELPKILNENREERIVEKEGTSVRSVYGSHTENEIFRRLSKHPRIVEPVKKILRSEVYVYQFKINTKSAFIGDGWEWHQDYIYWLKEDGMPSARGINVFIFLDDVNEFNGPLFLIPESHKEGVIGVPARNVQVLQNSINYNPYHDRPEWIYNLTAKLKYSIDKETVSRLVSQRGIVAPKGPPGSVLLTHPNIVHSSSNNISPFERVMIVITYNSVENIPVTQGNVRPEFLVSRDYKPIVTLDDNTLLMPGDR